MSVTDTICLNGANSSDMARTLTTESFIYAYLFHFISALNKSFRQATGVNESMRKIQSDRQVASSRKFLTQKGCIKNDSENWTENSRIERVRQWLLLEKFQKL